MRRTVFQINKMDCPTEEQIIRNRLRSVRGIEGMDFDLMNRRLTVDHTLDDPRDIEAALQSVGMDPELADLSDDASLSPPPSNRAAQIVLGISGVLALSSEIVSALIGTDLCWPVITLSILSIIVGGRQTLTKGLIAIRTFTLNINFLMSLAIVGAISVGEWPEAATVTFLFGLAEMIEAHSLDRARHAIRSLLQLTPEKAEVKREDGTWEETCVGHIEVGDMVRVRPGERIALDGTIRSGASSVDQSSITGESMPVNKAIGDHVFAGTINERGSFEFETTANRGDTTIARIIKAVQEAQAQKAPTQRFVDQFAKYYTPSVVGLALLVVVIPVLFHLPFAVWLYRALVMLVIACPCALVISTPVTVVSGLANAARNGILIKGGVHLENGRKLKVIAFDKTGTLTQGAPRLTDVVPLVDRSSDELLQIAASVDALSEHPVASGIVSGWTLADRTIPGSETEERKASAERALLTVSGFEALAGLGVKGSIDGVLYYVGNHRLAHELNICGSHVESVLEKLEAQAKTAVIVANSTTVLAVIAVADTLRESSVAAIHELHNMGLRTAMLTGDNIRTASAIAKIVGIDDARGDLLPEEKLAVIAEFATQGQIGMVGDGINDAPALAKASIGFAMGAAGTDTAMETADVALMNDDLGKLAEFILLSRAVGSVLIQNIVIALGIKVVFFLLAVQGHATLWMAVFADLGASLIVVFNGLRLLRFKPRRHSEVVNSSIVPSPRPSA